MDAMILLVAYPTDILRKSLNTSGYAKMVKFGFCHGIRTMILALDHPKCIALPFFMHFLDATQRPAFLLKEKVRNGMSGCKIVPTLMRYSFIL